MIAEGFDVASRHMGQTHHVQFVSFQECHHCSDLTFTDKTKNAFFSHGCTYHDRGRGTQRENALFLTCSIWARWCEILCRRAPPRKERERQKKRRKERSPQKEKGTKWKRTRRSWCTDGLSLSSILPFGALWSSESGHEIPTLIVFRSCVCFIVLLLFYLKTDVKTNLKFERRVRGFIFGQMNYYRRMPKTHPKRSPLSFLLNRFGKRTCFMIFTTFWISLVIQACHVGSSSSSTRSP